ncbi:hypothetical protein BVRB_2g036420 [Beta vulgaris subsp. vulgaris]|nr:hypothetical protein BVRB_2g036420 [Beta vulgaris subsp. vulgaris]
MLHKTQQEDEEDDILSLCDLPIYSDDSSDSSHTNSSYENSNDSFEFFPIDDFPPIIDQIIFCGKPIPSKETPTYHDPHNHKKCTHHFFSKIKSFSSSKRNVNGSLAKSNSYGSKFKWCFFMFGLQRYSVPTKMELADMKFRQSKNNNSTKTVEMLIRNSSSSCTDSNGKVEKGLSYLVRSLSCKSKYSLNVLD